MRGAYAAHRPVHAAAPARAHLSTARAAPPQPRPLNSPWDARACLVPPALALPRVEMPNVTAIMASVQEGLKTAATTVLAEKVKVRPFKCPNGKPLVTCLFDVCPKGACPGKVCIPDYCGKCSNK